MSDQLAVIQSEETIAELKKIKQETKDLIAVFKELVKEANSINSSFDAGRPRQYAEAIARLRDVTNQYADVERQLASVLGRVNSVEEMQARTATENARTRRELARAATEESRARQQAAREARSEARANQDSTSAFRTLQREMQQVRQRARDYEAQIFNISRELRDGTITQREYNQRLNEFSRNARNSTREAIALQNEIRRINQSTIPSSQRGGALSGRVTDVIKGVTAAGAIDKIAGYIVQLGEDAYETIKILDAQNLALKQIFETEAQISFQKEYLSEITNKYGLELVSTTDAYVKYSAAVKGTSLEGEKARQIFSSFAGASAKLGISAKETEGIFRALEQMISKGKIQAEELRGQLGDRMAGAFKIFADGIGVSTAELDKMLKDGKVIADDVLPQVAQRLEEVYNLKKAGDIDTLAAAQNRFKNEWTSFLDEMSSKKENVDFLASGIDALSYGVKFLLDILVKDGSAGRAVIDNLVSIIGSLFEALSALTGQTNTTSTKMEKFQATLQFISADINLLASAFKYLTDIVANFFSTMFQENGWDKFNKRMEESANSLISTYNKWDKLTSDADNMFKGYTPDQRRIKAQEDETKKYKEAWDKAKEAKQAYFQFNGKYFSSSTGRNTGKSLDEFIDRGGNLVKKETFQKTVLSDAEKAKKPKAYSGSKISGMQKDYLKDLEADKKNQLTILETAYVEEKISEEKYLKESLRINVEYYDKKIAYLKGKNASERKLEAEANLEKIKAIKETNKKLVEIESKVLETQFKKEQDVIERRSKDLERNKLISDSDRLKEQIDRDSKLINITSQYYEKQIELAANSAKRVLELERERDHEIATIEDRRLQRIGNIPQALVNEIEYQDKILQSNRELSFEKQKQLILADKKLSADEKSYQLAVLEAQNAIKANESEIAKQREIEDSINRRLLNEKSIGLPGIPTRDDIERLNEAALIIEKLTTENVQNKKDLDLFNFDKMARGFEPLVNLVSNGLKDLGLNAISDQFTAMYQKILKEGKDFSLSSREIFEAATAVISDFSQKFINAQRDRTISALDEQLSYSQHTTEQEIGFINGRLEALNSLGELNAEQMAERRRLEDEARVYKEQQAQREKLIATQKARAEQKAAAQQALINGALAATTTLSKLGFPAGVIPAALALAFGVAQSVAILSKDPVPKYFVGRSGGKEEMALTQEKGRELITDKSGNIKSLGSDNGAVMTHLDHGDKVFTASQTKSIISDFGGMPTIGSNIYKKIARQSLTGVKAPVMIHNNFGSQGDFSENFGKQLDRYMKKYDKPHIVKKAGKIIEYRGSNLPVTVGEYNLNTLSEIWY